MTNSLFGIKITDSLCDGLGLDFTPDELEAALNAVDYDITHESLWPFKSNMRERLLAQPRWILIHRTKMHQEDFFTEQIPRMKREAELWKKNYEMSDAETTLD